MYYGGIMVRMKVKSGAFWADSFLLGAILSLAFALRLYRLEDKDIWWDEGWSVWLARQDLLSIALRTASDEHPPLHYWLLHLWRVPAGEGEFLMRFSSVIFGVLAVALVYRVGLELGGRLVGILAALFLALSRFHIWWSQEIKMYTLGVFLTLLSLYLFVKLLRGGRRLHYLAYIVVTLSALYTLYLAVLVVMVENIFFILTFFDKLRSFSTSRGQVRKIPWALGQGVILLLYVPWMYMYFTRSLSYERHEIFDLGLALRLYATVMPLGISTYLERYTVQAVFFLLLAALGLAFALRGSKTQREGAFLAVLSLAIVPIALFLFSLPEQSVYQPKVSERYTILFLPMYMILIAMGLGGLWHPGFLKGWNAGALGLPFLALALGIMAYTLTDYYSSRQRTYHLPAMARFLSTFAQPQDAIFIYPDANWPVYRYYVQGDLHWYRVPYQAKMSLQEADHWLNPVAKLHGAIWLITAPEAARTDPEGEVRRWLEERFKKVDTLTFGRARLTLYSQEEGRELYTVPSPKALLRNGRGVPMGSLTFLGFDPIPSQVRAGDAIYAFSYFKAPPKTNEEYYTRAVIRAPDGTEVMARSPKALPPLSEDGSEALTKVVQARDRITIKPEVPSGTYQLGLEVKRLPDGEIWGFPLGTVYVRGSKTAESLNPAVLSQVDLGGKALLRGFTLDTAQARPGERLSLTLFWEALAEMDTSYTVFVHLKDDKDVVWALANDIPQGGAYPTTAWEEGDLVEDELTVPIAKIVPKGTYTLTAGMYDITTGERLVALGSDGQRIWQDEIPLGKVEITNGQ